MSSQEAISSNTTSAPPAHPGAATTSLSSSLDQFVPWPFSTFPHWIRCRFNFFRLHLLYILLLGWLAGVAIYTNENGRYPFINCVFTGYAASTLTGLTVIDTSEFKVTTKIGISLVTILGDAILLSIVPVYIRLRIFEKQARLLHTTAEKVPRKVLRHKVAEVCVEVREGRPMD